MGELLSTDNTSYGKGRPVMGNYAEDDPNKVDNGFLQGQPVGLPSSLSPVVAGNSPVVQTLNTQSPRRTR